MIESSSQTFRSRVMEKLATILQPALYFIRGLPVVREDQFKHMWVASKHSRSKENH
ncbi:hypothetical protein K3495_g10011 [Podosphaera aphanis]|nr:hypothetical protein K3495_g10011 [Podosphaera aphanis]